MTEMTEKDFYPTGGLQNSMHTTVRESVLTCQQSREGKRVHKMGSLDDQKHMNINPLGIIPENPQENTCQNMIIKPIKHKTRKPLPFRMSVLPVFSMGCSLKTMHVEMEGDNPYSVYRTARFPCSVFQIKQQSQKEKRYKVVSNFAGSKYNLFEGSELQLTIVFDSRACRQLPTRFFEIYHLASGVSSASLFRKNDADDLETLAQYPDNAAKIHRLKSDIPREGAQGQFIMQFGRKHVQPAVQNAVVVNSKEEDCMSLVKLGEKAFQVSWKGDIQRQWGVALALASLDFKWALQ